MGTVSQEPRERMYSWWWEGHSSPKNSKWLVEDLIEMDTRVKKMIGLIEEDADSFARRAEMYYKKRPELMKLMGEFYRAYCGLAARYDHITGLLRLDLRAMAEAYPNHVSLNELPIGFSSENYSRLRRSSDMYIHFDDGEVDNDSSPCSGMIRDADSMEDSNSFTYMKSLEESDMESRDSKFRNQAKKLARKSLKFEDEVVNQSENHDDDDDEGDFNAQSSFKSEFMAKQEIEILTLKTAFSSLKAENDITLLQYDELLKILSSKELEVTLAKEESKVVLERAVRSEAEVNSLKEALDKVEADRQDVFLRCQQCNEIISGLENRILETEKGRDEANKWATKAETDAQNLAYDIAILKAEKEASLVLYNESVERISEMEEKILRANEDFRKANALADKADKELESMSQTLVNERKFAATSVKESNETIAFLELKLRGTEEDFTKVSSEIEDVMTKLRSAEDKNLHLEKINQQLYTDLESLSQKLNMLNEELVQKQKEIKFAQSQCQEEQRISSIDIEKKAGMLEELGAFNKSLQNKIVQNRMENMGLSEVNLSLALTVKDSKSEISSLKEKIGKLEAEAEMLVSQKNKLLKESSDLKGEFKCLHEKHQFITMQVESLGLSPDSLASHFKNLHYENIRLGRICEMFREEKVACLQKLAIVDKLMEKNFMLERSASNLNVELDGVRKKVKELEEYCRGLKDENSVLVSNNSFLVAQLQSINRTLEKHAEERNCLEKSLHDANLELQECRGKSRDLEDSCRFLESKISARDGETEKLKSKIVILDVENATLRTQIETYAGAFVSLGDSVATLESRSSTCKFQEKYHNEKPRLQVEVADSFLLQEVSSEVCASNLRISEDSHSIAKEGTVDIDGLQTKIKRFEKSLVDREKHLLLENSMMKSKLETAIKQIEDLKSRGSSQRQLHIKGRSNPKMASEEPKLHNGSYENSENGRDMATKDILLDEISECSSVGFSRASTMEYFGPREIWEASFHKGSIDLTMEKAPKGVKARHDKMQQREHQRKRSHSFVDKEVTLDNLISRNVQGACLEAQDRKIMDRLDCDAQKLTKLHITVQELKKAMEITEKSKKGGVLEYETVKEQLEESEEAVIKLFNLNLRLKRSVEIEAFSMEETSALAFEEKRCVTRRKVSDQARRMSDKIGRLQLEVQKLQFLLIKLDDQCKSRPKIKIAERKTRVLLRDYLYSNGTRARPPPKRSTFCACAQPLTKGD